MKLILVIPATNATSERSFSALKRIKSYLRSTMKQERLNSLMTIHVHKDKTDKLELRAIGNEFVAANAQRTNIFGTFSADLLNSYLYFQTLFFIRKGLAE